jgi:hypothetical protein
LPGSVRGPVECLALARFARVRDPGVGEWGLGIGFVMDVLWDDLWDHLRRSFVLADGDFAQLGHWINTGVDAALGWVGMVC